MFLHDNDDNNDDILAITIARHILRNRQAKMCINIYFTFNPFTVNTDSIMQIILYDKTIYYNKYLYNSVFFFQYKFYKFIEEFLHTQV